MEKPRSRANKYRFSDYNQYVSFWNEFKSEIVLTLTYIEFDPGRDDREHETPD